MRIKINGKPTEARDDCTIEQLVAEMNIEGDGTGIAVAVNDTVIPRNRWTVSRLEAGDVVEIIHAVQGG